MCFLAIHTTHSTSKRKYYKNIWILSLTKGSDSLATIATNDIFYNGLSEMINNSTEDVKLGSNSNRFYRNVELILEMSLRPHVALTVYRDLVKYVSTDTRRKQMQLNKNRKTQVNPVLLP